MSLDGRPGGALLFNSSARGECVQGLVANSLADHLQHTRLCQKLSLPDADANLTKPIYKTTEASLQIANAQVSEAAVLLAQALQYFTLPTCAKRGPSLQHLAICQTREQQQIRICRAFCASQACLCNSQSSISRQLVNFPARPRTQHTLCSPAHHISSQASERLPDHWRRLWAWPAGLRWSSAVACSGTDRAQGSAVKGV